MSQGWVPFREVVMALYQKERDLTGRAQRNLSDVVMKNYTNQVWLSGLPISNPYGKSWDDGGKVARGLCRDWGEIREGNLQQNMYKALACLERKTENLIKLS